MLGPEISFAPGRSHVNWDVMVMISHLCNLITTQNVSLTIDSKFFQQIHFVGLKLLLLLYTQQEQEFSRKRVLLKLGMRIN